MAIQRIIYPNVSFLKMLTELEDVFSNPDFELSTPSSTSRGLIEFNFAGIIRVQRFLNFFLNHVFIPFYYTNLPNIVSFNNLFYLI